MTTEQLKEFWDRISDVRTGMMEAGGHFVPMTHNSEPEDGNLWIITARGTDTAASAEAGQEGRYIICSDSEGIYAEITGRLETSNDAAKLDEVWNTVADTWFEDGKQDPDLVLVRYRPKTAEVWLGPESGVSFLFKIAKSKVTGDKPDLGQQFSLTFP